MTRSISEVVLLVLAGVWITVWTAPDDSRAAFEAASVRSYDSASSAQFFTVQGGPVTSGGPN